MLWKQCKKTIAVVDWVKYKINQKIKKCYKRSGNNFGAERIKVQAKVLGIQEWSWR